MGEEPLVRSTTPLLVLWDVLEPKEYMSVAASDLVVDVEVGVAGD